MAERKETVTERFARLQRENPYYAKTVARRTPKPTPKPAAWTSRDGSHGYIPERERNPAHTDWFEKRFHRTSAANREFQQAREAAGVPDLGETYDFRDPSPEARAERRAFYRFKRQHGGETAGPRPTPWMDQISRVGDYHPDQYDAQYQGEYGNPEASEDWAVFRGPGNGLMPGRGTRGPNDGTAGTGRGGPGGTLTPRMPTSLTDKPDGMIPTVSPNMPRPSLAQRGVGEGEDIPGVSGRLRGLLSRTSPYMQRARTRATQAANRRGLMSSSIAAGAGEAAAIDAALPIAQADAALAESERGRRSQEFMQAREHRVQMLMQQRGLDHDAAQNQFQRDFAGRQAALDREQQRFMQERGIGFEEAQALANRELKQQIAIQTATQAAQDQYQTSLDRLTANLDLPQEERHRMEEHYAYVYDEALRGLEALYGIELTWTPRQRPAEAA